MSEEGRTPSQTIGPFFGFALPWPDGARVVPAGTAGAIRIEGQVLDGAGQPVPDALVETWQLGPEPCRGFARCPTDAGGRYAIVTVKPPAAGGAHASCLAVSIFARGLLKRLTTRMYFPDEAEANARDPVLAGLTDGRDTLIAVPVPGGYRFDLRLQGAGETVFFEHHE